MDKAIKHHLGKEIKERVRLNGGFSFETCLLTLSDNNKIVFRAQNDFTTDGGREIIISEVLEREQFFYESVNKKLGRICPMVYVIDSSLLYFHMPYCIMEYIEGVVLSVCLDHLTIRHFSKT